jgi:hypothetical protein
MAGKWAPLARVDMPRMAGDTRHARLPPTRVRLIRDESNGGSTQRGEFPKQLGVENSHDVTAKAATPVPAGCWVQRFELTPNRHTCQPGVLIHHAQCAQQWCWPLEWRHPHPRTAVSATAVGPEPTVSPARKSPLRRTTGRDESDLVNREPGGGGLLPPLPP